MDYAADQKYLAIFVVIGLAIVALSTAWQMHKPIGKTCFSSSKTYQIHPVHGGADVTEGWAVQGDAFNQCVRRAEAADASLHRQYQGPGYNLTLSGTIGCHAPCDE